MDQKISYGVRFIFTPRNGSLQRMPSSVKQFIRVLGNIDRLLTEALGAALDHRPTLRELGAEHFDYTVKLTVHHPGQIPLGAHPNPEGVRNWMCRVRNDAVDAAPAPGRNDGETAGRWDFWAREGGLTESLLYIAPTEEAVSPMLDDLRRVTAELGGRDSVVML